MFARHNNFYNSIHNPFAKRVFYNNFYNIHTDTLFPVLILFYLQYTYTGELGSGLTFILSLQIILLYLNSICQQRELPLFLVAVAGRFLFLFILFWEGKGDWGYLYF